MIPKALRVQIGLVPGEVDVVVDGAALRVEPLATDALEERDGRLVIPPSGAPIDDATVLALRDAGRK